MKPRMLWPEVRWEVTELGRLEVLVLYKKMHLGSVKPQVVSKTARISSALALIMPA